MFASIGDFLYCFRLPARMPMPGVFEDKRTESSQTA